MEIHYSSEKAPQILIALFKEFGIKKIIASPGKTNVTFVASVQQDPYFQVYSAVDERSAAYMACGLAAESGEPIVISCTGATASRNYMPGLTEAYYRKLPVIALTSNTGTHNRHNLIAQQIDRSISPIDIAKIKISIPFIKDKEDEQNAAFLINKALLELSRNGGGPIHIDYSTRYSEDYSVKTIPEVRKISRISVIDKFPSLDNKKIIIFIGSHKNFTKEETELIERFCHQYGAVVYCDHTSGYYGKYRVQYALMGLQPYKEDTNISDILIHLGEISGDYYSLGQNPKEVWRISADGELRDTFHKLKYVFEMPEIFFFRSYLNSDSKKQEQNLQYQNCLRIEKETREKIPELPFSNIWIAQQMCDNLPIGSELHLGILNTLRSWNFFNVPQGVETFCNVGGFGIDGCVSSTLGASLYNSEKLYFCVVGDLAFMYDLNSICNRHVGANLRIMLINNGLGAEFTNYGHSASKMGDLTRTFIAAEGHFGKKSKKLVRDFATDLGFEYLSASTKEEFFKNKDHFLSSTKYDKPIIFEIFTDSKNESEAIKIMSHLVEKPLTPTQFIKNIVKDTVGEERIVKARKLLNI